VSSASGLGLAGVTATIDDLDLEDITDSNGDFRFSDVPAGSHTLRFVLNEYEDSQEAEVVSGEVGRVDLMVDWEVGFAETITVASVSRRAERIVEAPASVTLVTEIEIERQASHGQMPKLLEFTPGVEPTQSGIYDFNFNTRGFNSSLNRRVQTLIDGRNPSVPFLGNQEWAGLSFPLDDLNTVELVRGPSSALYGANASSGVLNMVTKAPRGATGGTLRLTGGQLSTLMADVKWAGELGNDWYLKALGGARDHGDFSVSRNGQAEYSEPCTATGQTDCLPQERVGLDPEDDVEIFYGSLRLDKYLANGRSFTLEGGTADIGGPVFQTGIGRVQVVDAKRPWARANFNSPHWNVLAYYTGRDAPKQTALQAGNNVALDSTRLALEVQGNWGFAEDSARVVAGAYYAEEDVDSFDPAIGAQTLMFEPHNEDFQAVFGQLDWSISDKFKLVLAGRYDRSSLFDSQFSPKGSLVYAINSNHTLRLTYNEAFQQPNYSEFFLQASVAPPLNLQPFEGFCAPFGVSCGFAPGPTFIYALGNEDLDVEQVKMWEIGYNVILGRRTFLTIDYYNSKNERFITDLLGQLSTSLGRVNPNFGPYTPPADLPAPAAQALQAALQGALGPSYFILSNNFDGTPILAAVSYTNFGEVDSQGVEVGLNTNFRDNWNFDFTYSWFDFEIVDAAEDLEEILLPNAPEHKFALGLGYSTNKWDAGISARWVDEFRWVVGPFQGQVESYTTADLVGNYSINPRVSIGLNWSNVFDNEHWESFGGDLIGSRALASVTFNW
jgi:iron complex outermembrane receptor protein